MTMCSLNVQIAVSVGTEYSVFNTLIMGKLNLQWPNLTNKFGAYFEFYIYNI